MDTIAQGAMLDDPVLIDRAVFGLAMLRAPATPPGILAAVVENEKLPLETRTQAAWALYQIQEMSRRRDEILAIWRRYAGPDRERIPELALVQAVRGLGLSRDAANADLVVPLLQSPLPLVRMAAASAIGRMNDQAHALDLLALIGPDETNANVRLHARKALQALVGYADYEYDVEAWRRAFERK
jgi:HEAT repeat protein